MRPRIMTAFPKALTLSILLLLAGCVQSQQDLAEVDLNRSGKECSARSDANCFFLNSPVRLGTQKVIIPGRSYDFYRLAQALEFIDGRNRSWVAPPDTLTDGASIPEIFVQFIGDPTSAEFTNAAALHDAYCGIGNEDGPVYRTRTWQETHRLFYDALVVGGTPEAKAKVMFAAVWLGGPRWYPSDQRDDQASALLPQSLKMQAFRETRQFIARGKPSIAELIIYMDWLERRMRKTVYGGKSGSVGTSLAVLVPSPASSEVISPIGGGAEGSGAVQSP